MHQYLKSKPPHKTGKILLIAFISLVVLIAIADAIKIFSTVQSDIPNKNMQYYLPPLRSIEKNHHIDQIIFQDSIGWHFTLTVDNHFTINTLRISEDSKAVAYPDSNSAHQAAQLTRKHLQQRLTPPRFPIHLLDSLQIRYLQY